MKRKSRNESVLQSSMSIEDESANSNPKKKSRSPNSKDPSPSNLQKKSSNHHRDQHTGELELSQFSFSGKKPKKESDAVKSKTETKQVEVPKSIKKGSKNEDSSTPKKKVIRPSKKEKENINDSNTVKRPKSKSPNFDSENTKKKSAPKKSQEKKSKRDDSSFSEKGASSSNDDAASLVSEHDSFEEESEKPRRKKSTNTKKQASNSANAKKPKTATKKSESKSGKKVDKKDKKSPISYLNPADMDEEGVMGVDETLDNPNIKFELPEFLDKDLRDAKMRKPGDPGYDPTTVHVPENFYKKLCHSMKQYWDVKRVNFDKMVAINLCDFYWFYYGDALIASKLMDLKICAMKNGRFFTYQSCKAFREAVPNLLNQGHRVVLIERLSDKLELFEMRNDKNSDEFVKREVCQVLTRGTYIDQNQLDYSSRYTLCIFEYKLRFGIVFLDTTTQEFHIGEFTDDVNKTHLRTILTKIKPLEVVFYNEYISEDTLNILKGISTKPAKTPFTLLKPKTCESVFNSFARYKKDLPAVLDNVRYSVESSLKKPGAKFDQVRNFTLCQALGLCVEYLEDIMLVETVLTMGEFYDYDESIQKQGSLYLDSQAIENLEILDIGYINVFSETLSLFGDMDHTATPFGKRLFKRWVTAPLLDPEQIKSRMEAVDDLIEFSDIADVFQEKMRKLPDLERMINRIYNLSDRKRLMAAHMEDFALNRLKDFLAFLPELKKVESIMQLFESYVPKFKNERLKQLCTFKDVDIQSFKQKKSGVKKGDYNGLFPRIAHIVDDLEKMVIEKENMIMPAPGICKGMDRVIEKMQVIRIKLERILEEKRRFFNTNEIVYVNSRKKFELEFPEKLIDHNSRPKDLIITSKRKGFLRYQTPAIEELVEQLVPLEYEFQRELVPFIVDYFRAFYERNSHWRQVILCLSELDCLCSLAKFAKKLPIKCKPSVLPMDQPVRFELKEMVHPMAARNNPNFVANSFTLEHPVFLITGPNMGGKSTFLRMVCIATVMAQIGSYVPAESFSLTAVDRIFTRIGASDRIMEGKSTFFVEMEETLNIVNEATKNSLVILDELGRGTSTYDGVSIAFATLKYIAEKINCITLFATHYHFLIEEFSIYNNIKSYYMLSEFDEEKDEIKFRYKFVPGKADRSHGIVMGKMAGLPESVLTSAKHKEKFMTQEKRNISFEKNLMEKFSKAVFELTKLENEHEKNLDVNQLLVELENLI